ncbi:MAG: hypothetical protein CSB33_01105 [Desulfobacterales bacterium]|nr:MAG: hypothetical protein CSB33_01105 [Desulfobacterales bacterium]
MSEKSVGDGDKQDRPLLERSKCWFLFAALLPTLFCACRPAPSDRVEISWATNQHFTRFEAVARFEQIHPEIRVIIRPVSEPRQFLLQCLYGDSPDVITFFHPDSFQGFAENNLLLPFAADECQPWPFYPGLKDYCFRHADQALMALPQVAYPYVLYFNPDLVSPSIARTIRSWDDLFSLVAPRLPLPPRNGKRVFGLDIQSDIIWFTTWYWQRGGRFFSPDTAALVLDMARAANTFDEMAKWRSIRGLLPRPGDRLNLPSKGASQGVLGSLFLQGRAMFYWSGSWKICDFVNQDKVKWDLIRLPAGPVNDITLLGGNSFGVSARSRHPEQAKQFVRYLASLDAQKRHIAHRIYMPSRPDCPVPPQYRLLKEQIRHARTLEYSPDYNEKLFREIIEQAVSAHRLGRMSSDQAAAAMREGLESGAIMVTP